MSKDIVITGSGGILGSTLLEKFSRKSDYSVYAITSQVERLTEKHKSSNHIHILSSINELPNDKSYITLNCAFPRVSKGKELAAVFNYTNEVIEKVSEKSCSHFINISTQSVYAQSGEKIQTESSVVEPSNLYGMTKYAIEHLVSLKAKQHKMEVLNIRLGSLASPSFDQRMINRFYDKIINNEPITVDRGEPKVSYLHVEDAADGLIKLIKTITEGKKIKELYNLANNDWMFINDLVLTCIEYGYKMGLQSTEMLYSEKISEYNNVVNSNLFYIDINWQPKYSMENLIQNIFDAKLR